MNLYFRLIWIIGCSFFKPRIDVRDEISLNLRVLPNDLDINRHLNNGRFLTILDLGSIDLFLRSGLFFRAIRNGHLSAAGYFKGAFVSRNGLVPNTAVEAMFGHRRGPCVIPPAVENWMKAERSISP